MNHISNLSNWNHENSTSEMHLPLLCPMNTEFTEYKGWYHQFEIYIKFNENKSLKQTEACSTENTLEYQLNHSLSHSIGNEIGFDNQKSYSSNNVHILGVQNFNNVNIHISPLGNMENKIYKLLASRMNSCRTQNDVFREIKDTLDRLVTLQAVPKLRTVLHAFPSKIELPKSTSQGYYTWIRNEAISIGWSHISSINTNAESLTLIAYDSRNREHKLELKNLNSWFLSWKNGNTQVALETVHELPDKGFMILLNGVENALSHILSKFQEVLAKYELFWDQMDDLDEHTRVVEPSAPNRSHVMRAMSIGHHITMKIQVDPSKPNLIPICEFIGSESTIHPLKELWMQQAPSDWNYDIHQKTLRQNIETILSFKFPSPKEKNVNEYEYSFICGICYYMRSELDELPTVVCENEKCMKSYHKSCIIEWFESQHSKTTFDSIHGECLYCSSEMHVRKNSG